MSLVSWTSHLRVDVTGLFDANVHAHMDSELVWTQLSSCLADDQNWYCSLPGHDYFCEVHEDFIEDDFNLTGE